MKSSPYKDQDPSTWLATTQTLIADHPLAVDDLIELVVSAWDGVWSTEIGKGEARLSLREVDPPATVVGYFFEKLLAKALAAKYPGEWAGGTGGTEKDLHFVNDPAFSVEVKSSGQLGLKIYGNRSYGQEVENADRAKKDKSGYYLTVNFYGDRLSLVRFGWIDGSDWIAQKSSTGQMAGLGKDVYLYKLVPIVGDYTLNAPIRLLDGVGGGVAEACADIGITTIRDALANPEKLIGKLQKVYAAAVTYENSFGVKKAQKQGSLLPPQAGP